MTRALLALFIAVLGSTGCLIVPKEQTTLGPVTTRPTTPWTAGPAGKIALDVRPAGATIQVRAAAPRMCSRLAQEDREIRREQAADLEMAGSLPDLGPLNIFYVGAIPVAAVSGLVTGLVIVTDKPQITHETYARQQTVLCPVVAAAFSVVVKWPSGALAQVLTDANGDALLAIPATEPVSGVAIVTGDGASHAVAYDGRVDTRAATVQRQQSPSMADLAPMAKLAHKECIAARSAAMREAQQISNLSERAKALQALPDCTSNGP